VKIYTRQGDEGRTRLFGGLEVSKDDARVEAYGTVDELMASLGVVLALDPDDGLGTGELVRVQEDLFVIGARLAAARPEQEMERGTIPVLDDSRVVALEAWIDRLDDELPPLDAFVLPGGSRVGAQLHVARTVCRRAERSITALVADDAALSLKVVPYINRLSDLLFTLARTVNRRTGSQEATWLPMRRRESLNQPADPQGEES
jgi:cob(I)alamin adenosyltransferase